MYIYVYTFWCTQSIQNKILVIIFPMRFGPTRKKNATQRIQQKHKQITLLALGPSNQSIILQGLSENEILPTGGGK